MTYQALPVTIYPFVAIIMPHEIGCDVTQAERRVTDSCLAGHAARQTICAPRTRSSSCGAEVRLQIVSFGLIALLMQKATTL